MSYWKNYLAVVVGLPTLYERDGWRKREQIMYQTITTQRRTIDLLEAEVKHYRKQQLINTPKED